MFRKRIGSVSKNISLDDDVDMIDEDLTEVSSIGGSMSSDNASVVRRQKLSQIAANVRNRRESDVVSDTSADKDSHDVECTCDICMKTFIHKSTDKEWSCLFCGHKMEVEDLEEVNELQENPYKDQMDENVHEKVRNDFLGFFIILLKHGKMAIKNRLVWNRVLKSIVSMLMIYRQIILRKMMIHSMMHWKNTMRIWLQRHMMMRLKIQR